MLKVLILRAQKFPIELRFPEKSLVNAEWPLHLRRLALRPSCAKHGKGSRIPGPAVSAHLSSRHFADNEVLIGRSAAIPA